ncbi:hypothetical protein HDA40_004794 [Hamadaea flava]|uniref:DUF11 domain-containing protein n=1 Tax=Hamadaea flava TaxID=1742688 RepID=A0ABV8LGD3_9ACTN|nr:DUF11 domain-containing protein [Hamadaea flava]MCP2326287.1 hypothetical protein [Hamadaea flava]
MWMRRVLAAAAAALVAGLATGAATAYAAPTTADLAVSASAVGGRVGQAVDVRYVLRNNGPQSAAPLTYTVDFTAPPGTRIVSTGGGICQPASGTHARCAYSAALADGARRQLTLRLRIDSAPTGCGALVISYADDPRPGNNTAAVRVAVDGRPRNCSGSDTTASPRPTKSKVSPTPSDEPTVDATEEFTDETSSPDDSPQPATMPQDTVGGLGLGSVLVIGGGAVLVSLGGLLLWWMLRKDPDDDADDATGPIYR